MLAGAALLGAHCNGDDTTGTQPSGTAGTAMTGNDASTPPSTDGAAEVGAVATNIVYVESSHPQTGNNSLVAWWRSDDGSLAPLAGSPFSTGGTAAGDDPGSIAAASLAAHIIMENTRFVPSTRALRTTRSSSCRSPAKLPAASPTQLPSSFTQFCGPPIRRATRLGEADTKVCCHYRRRTNYGTLAALIQLREVRSRPDFALFIRRVMIWMQ
jgi:hypothetical protein